MITIWCSRCKATMPKHHICWTEADANAARAADFAQRCRKTALLPSVPKRYFGLPAMKEGDLTWVDEQMGWSDD